MSKKFSPPTLSSIAPRFRELCDYADPAFHDFLSQMQAFVGELVAHTPCPFIYAHGGESAEEDYSIQLEWDFDEASVDIEFDASGKIYFHVCSSDYEKTHCLYFYLTEPNIISKLFNTVNLCKGRNPFFYFSDI